MNWHLRTRILVPTVALVAGLTIIISAVAFWESRTMLKNTVELQLGRECHVAFATIDRWAGEQWTGLGELAGDPRIVSVLTGAGGGEEAETAALLARTVVHLDSSALLLVADAKGDVVAASEAKLVRQLNLGDRDYFRRAWQGESVVSDVVVSRVSNRPVVTFARPVSAAGRTIGVVVDVIDLDTFSERMIAPMKVLETGYAYLAETGGSGSVVAHQDPAKILKIKLAEYDWGREILGRKDGIVNYTFQGVGKSAVLRRGERLPWVIVFTVPRDEILAPVAHMTRWLVGLGVVALVIGSAVAIGTARMIVKPIGLVARRLGEGSETTATIAAETSKASQELAGRTNEQASSLEESSAALEQLTTSATSARETAAKANTLARDVRTAAETGAGDVSRMNRAMDGIKESGDQIAKIIKTIDEIAFQTNILALNAAVEAARAGEAGMGFAVVAEEVRNLAQRSAQAAKETASMIERAIVNTTQGVQISAQVGGTLNGIVEKMRALDMLAGESARLAGEQTQGLAQVSKTVITMSELTQRNAGTAEETAAAAEELNGQTEALKDAIKDLETLVDGKSRRARDTASAAGPGAAPSTSQGSARGGRRAEVPAEAELDAFAG